MFIHLNVITCFHIPDFDYIIRSTTQENLVIFTETIQTENFTVADKLDFEFDSNAEAYCVEG